MLAYVFTHWPADPDRRGAYEAGVAGFHRGLAAAGSEGFERSFLYRVQGAYWVGAEVGYEDWYLVEGSYALDPLNEIAVSPRLRPVHDTAAHAAGGGMGALYRLVSGLPEPGSGEVSWLSKPAGEGYPEFYGRFSADAVLWRRQMVLGAATEFMLEGDPPPGLAGVRVRRELLFG
jgi:hypothetical protein